ncbi:hypothetical protein ANTQUA_LOCUS10547 [Anthophora quadrimaculata]
MGYHERRWLLKTAGRWPWKSESAKECVTTHLPKQLALKMNSAEASRLYSAVSGKRGGTRVWARACLEPPSVQILVVVANTSARTWRTDVEKGFV